MHRGEIVQKRVEESGIKITDLQKKLRVSRTTVYNYFENDHLSFETIGRIGHHIGHDFSQDFPEFSMVFENMAREEEAIYGKSSEDINLIKAWREVDRWKTKCIEYLEELNRKQEELDQLRQTYHKLLGEQQGNHKNKDKTN